MAKSDEILNKIGGLSTQVGIMNTRIGHLNDNIGTCNKGIDSLVKNNKEQWKAINQQGHKIVKVEARHSEEDKQAEIRRKEKDKQVESAEVKLGRKFTIYAALIGITGAIIVGVILKVI